MPKTLATGVVAKWQEARKLYQADRCDLAQSTFQTYHETLDRFFAEFPDIQQVGRLQLLTWLQQFTHWSTYNVNLAALKSFFAWAADFYQFPDPTIRLKSRKPDTLPDSRFVNENEYRAVYGFHGYGRDIAVFLGNTGLRAAEFLGYRKEHIAGQVLTVLGKGRKVRKVPLNQTAWQILNRYDFALNLKKNKQYLTYTNLRYRMEHLAKMLNLQKFGPHSFRHYFATTLINRGANIADVSKLLGHSNISITVATYYHPQSLDCVGLLDNS